MIHGERKRSWGALLLCILAAAVVYGNSLDVPFYLDDFRNIIENRHLHLSELSLTGIGDVVTGSTLRTRPVANVSFALNYYFHQENVAGYHIVNIAIHILTAFFLFQLASTTMSSPGLRGMHQDRYLIATLAAVLWLVHPLHTQTVTYIVQRMNGMAVMFYVLSLWLYARGRLAASAKSWAMYAGSFAAGLLAIGSKEIAVTLPFFVLLYEWFFFQDLDRQWLVRKLWLFSIPLLFVGLLVLIYTDNPIDLVSGYEGRPFTMIERLLTQPRVVLLYAGLLFFPFPGWLNIDHHVEFSRSLVDPVSTALALVLIMAALVLAFVAAGRHRLLSFALFWYLGNLAIESSVLSLELVFEHRTYLPSVFVVAALTAFVFQKCRPRWVAGSLICITICICSVWTIQRNNLWRDPVAFWEDCAAKSSGKARPYINLSSAYRERGDFDNAIYSAQTAIRLDPRFVNGFVALGTAYLEKGDHDQAIRSFKAALHRMPGYAEVYNSLAKAYLGKGRVPEAISSLQENLRLDPGSYEALANLASIKASRGMYREAIIDFQKALQLGGLNPDVLFNLAMAYTQVGEYAHAVEAYRKLLVITPDDNEAAANMQRLLQDTGKNR